MKILNAIVSVAYMLSTSTALAANSVGQAMAVIDVASTSGQAGKRTLSVGTDIFVGDLVQTDGGGEAQLLFDDGTRMVVGANSSLVIEEFLFRGKAAENRFAVTGSPSGRSAVRSASSAAMPVTRTTRSTPRPARSACAAQPSISP